MYLIEWQMWMLLIDRAHSTDPKAKNSKSASQLVYASDEEKDVQAARQKASSRPKMRGPVYKYSDHILEARAGASEDKRGLISILSTMVIALIILGTVATAHYATELISSIANVDSTIDGHALFLVKFFLALTSCYTAAYLKYGLKITRLEMFTSRHLLVRFNRLTGQVHLHRPLYCGGVVTLPWHGITSSAAPGGNGGALTLSLFWSSQTTKMLYPEIVWVGKVSTNPHEIQAEWEFIRRFMDEGPEGLPRPRITSHFPWPWQAFTPQFEGLSHYFRHSSQIIKLGLVLISPAFLIIGLGHWLSLLLCWKPRWPKIIREAGLPGKPIPPLTTLADRPPHIQERLRQNAHLWAIRPGQRPPKKPRATRRRAKPGNQSTTDKESSTDETHRADRPQT
ncbi:hypothetical protein GIB23_15380 [Pseudomonas putida]|uniref:DUF6708 domain-containing protein n=1 Tax=Pseudomonas putida TaxID=303 RepID=UPI001A8F4B04|nr:DUF6708 domain-containing protein [Pseudomonas putida]MBO0368475.1 hypothetical protein [Pseudomonas putida]